MTKPTKKNDFSLKEEKSKNLTGGDFKKFSPPETLLLAIAAYRKMTCLSVISMIKEVDLCV